MNTETITETITETKTEEIPSVTSVRSVPGSSVTSVLPPSSPSADSALSALNPLPPPPRRTGRPGRPLSRLECLSERQLEHINSWLKDRVPCRQIIELCRTEFQKEIPYMTIVRYSNRTELFRHLDAFTDSQEAAAELSQYAATGDPTFSGTTLQLLEQQAFDLALAYNRDSDADDLSTLTKLWTLIHKAKSTDIRARHATVQERKCDLRAQELDLKRHLAEQKQLSVKQTAQNQPSSTIPNAQSTMLNPQCPTTTPSIPNLQSSIYNLQSPTLRPGPHPLPPEVIANNIRFGAQLRAAKAAKLAAEKSENPNRNSVPSSPSAPSALIPPSTEEDPTP